MEFTLNELIDIEKMHSLMLAFHKLTGIPVGLLDNNANILIKIAWQPICTEFHRKNPETLKSCIESDHYIDSHINEEKFVYYECKNGLVDAAIPIVVSNQHLGNLFLGQFFFNPPDKEKFKEQAEIYGFEKEEYLKALEKVPIYSKDLFYKAMDYYYELIQFLIASAETRRLILQKSEIELYQKKLLKSLLNTVPIPVFYKDWNKHFIGCNRAFENFFSVVEKDIIGCSIEEIFGMEFVEIFDDQDKYLTSDNIVNYEKVITLKNEIPRNIIIYKSKFYIEENSVGYIGSIIDITTTMNAFNKLEETLSNNEVLLKEVHHRVKNNLQIISSLLNMQSHYLNDENDIKLFNDSRERIRTMALIHEKLYKSNDLSKIDFKDYTISLIDAVKRSYDLSNNIILEYNIDNFYLDIDTAIPCGLLINEVVTNSLKYAFPENLSFEYKPHVKVNLSYNNKQSEYFLEICDNGIGFEAEKNLKNPESLGIKLIDALSRQLSGEYNYNSEKGTCFTLVFKGKE